MTARFENERWLDDGEFADDRPLHRRVYEMWWGRPWPVYRSTDRDPDIPVLPDIACYGGPDDAGLVCPPDGAQ